ncbi:OLC1v1021457C1 [Oldenlandia corymbosa var. corymbosa]|uniref:OLC1v1021457C1 n=1 Tax=Oldenlandia corymbosa var. corymbosa TaxID=529605 RepID=A0AAV1BVQ5_OLDCO|nr:OLC1v1021457C1 [Oldenlandia corymbosa var. corymbosa]
MASIAKKCLFFFLLALIFSVQIQARDSQFFNKVPSNVNKVEKETDQFVEIGKIDKQEQVPSFVPENENGGYGLYGHESGQLPPATTTAAANTNPSTTTTAAATDETYKTIPNSGEPKESYPKYLPKNYNTESYVTEPEGYRGQVDDDNINKNTDFYNGENRGEFDNNKNTNYYNGANRPEFDNNKNAQFYNTDNSYYNNNYNNNEEEENQEQDLEQDFGETKLMGKSYSTNPYSGNSNNYNYGNNYYNGEQQGMSDNRFKTNYNYYNHNVGYLNGVQKQGMSDTRFLENGKYFYDVSMEQQNFNNGPYGSSANNRGYYANPQNSYEFNNYQNQDDFQNFQEDSDLP